MSVDVRPAVVPPWMIVLADADLFPPPASHLSQDDPAVATLARHGIPVVLVSHQSADAVRSAQRRLGLRGPFISDGGTALHIPAGYFDELLGLGQPSGDWRIVVFRADDDVPSFSRAIRLLLLLYWNRRQQGLVVGVTDRNDGILTHADVPIIVRNPRIDQESLHARVPDAYLTSATGPEGWAEGILGPVEA